MERPIFTDGYRPLTFEACPRTRRDGGEDRMRESTASDASKVREGTHNGRLSGRFSIACFPLQSHQCDIILLLHPFGGEALEFVQQEVDERAATGVRPNHRREPWHAKHITLRVMRLHQAITIEEQALARRKPHFLFVVSAPRHHPQRHPRRCQFIDSRTVSSIWPFISCFSIARLSAFRIKNSIETGGKHTGWNFGIEQIIDPS